MHVVRHTIGADQFLSLVPDDASDVFEKVFFEFRANQRKAAINSKDSLNVNLGEGVRHEDLTFRS